MHLRIFNVEHGACALLTADDNTRLMIDCGQNAKTNWKPGTHLRGQSISRLEMLAITNYDEDHASGANDLFDKVDVQWLWRNKGVSPSTIRSLKSEDGMGPGIDRLVREIETKFTASAVPGTSNVASYPFQGLIKTFSNSYPEFDDENNLSLAIHINCNGIGVLFPGDLERAGWLKLLEQEEFRNALRNTKVFVASHHGRENGCCEEVFSYCKPYYVVISDKGYAYDTQRTIPFYSKYAQGGPFRNDKRYILTTRSDGNIDFMFRQDGWHPY